MIRAASRLFESLLAASGAKIAILAHYYNALGMAFVLACHRVGIPTVDVQHGWQLGDHAAYMDWCSLPPSGYELLPRLFWCWSQEEVDGINAWATGARTAHWAVLGGNPWHWYWLEGAGQDIGQRFQLPRTGSTNILVTVQPPPVSALNTLRSVMEGCPKSWKWWLRLHPRCRDAATVRATAAFFQGRADCVVEEAGRAPLPLLLQKVDLHITANSSTIIEAAEFGVPSIVLDPLSCETFKTEVARCMVFHAGDVDAVRQLASVLVTRRESAGIPHPGKTPETLYRMNNGVSALVNLIEHSVAAP
jgi:hypothetical protein